MVDPPGPYDGWDPAVKSPDPSRPVTARWLVAEYLLTRRFPRFTWRGSRISRATACSKGHIHPVVGCAPAVGREYRRRSVTVQSVVGSVTQGRQRVVGVRRVEVVEVVGVFAVREVDGDNVRGIGLDVDRRRKRQRLPSACRLVRKRPSSQLRSIGRPQGTGVRVRWIVG